MKLKLKLLILTIGIVYNGFAQIKDFDLSKYALPDLKRSSLETYFNLANSFDSQTENDQNIKLSSFDSDWQINYITYLNTAKYQRTSQLNSTFSNDWNKRKYVENSNYKSNFLNSRISYELTNRVYFDKNFFYETDASVYYNYLHHFSNESENNQPEEENVNNQHLIMLNLPLKAGIGRIESVGDACQAIYIIDELAKVNRMTTDKTDQQIIEFASLISHLKNERYFDSRLKKIADIVSLDSFLVSKNYVLQSDASYFATLIDFWNYANFTRASGTRLSVALQPGYSLSYNKFDNNQYIEEKDVRAFILNAGLELKHEKPINFFWQNSIALNAYFGYINSKILNFSNSDINYVLPNLQLEFSQSLGYFPNTRTNFNWSYSLNYLQFLDKGNVDNNIFSTEGKIVNASTYLDFNYYISPKFRLNIYSSASYNLYDLKNENILNISPDKVNAYYLYYLNYLYANPLDRKHLALQFNVELIYKIF